MLNRVKVNFKKTIRYSFLYQYIHPRKTHAYCIGTAKSGTHSISSLFDDKIRSKHEAESGILLDKIFDYQSGNLADGDFRDFIFNRDRRLWLEIDSSQLNFFILKFLLELYPSSKFILTIRDPYSWLDSYINHQLARGGSKKWIKFRDFRFQSNNFTHKKEEAILMEKGLYTLDGYLSYWANHNQTVINEIPPKRLFILRTDKITSKAYEIAEFLKISKKYVKKNQSHAFKAKYKYGILEQLDQEYLEMKVNEYCRDLLDKIFPEQKN